MTLHITGTGIATKIGNHTTTDSASLNLTVNVTMSSHGRAKLIITSGTLKIGNQTYTVVKGHGIINFHSHKVILHVLLKSSNNSTVRLILFGRASGLPKSLSLGNSFHVDFMKPESKLAGKWFLSFPGATVTRVA